MLQGNPITDRNASTVVQALAKVRVLILREISVEGGEFLAAVARRCSALERLVLCNVSDG
jgi:hypothetical protein